MDYFDLGLLEERVKFYLSSISKLEYMCNSLFEVFSKSEKTDINISDVINIYVRLFEIHERVITLITTLLSNVSLGINKISKEESKFLILFSSLDTENRRNVIEYMENVNNGEK